MGKEENPLGSWVGGSVKGDPPVNGEGREASRLKARGLTHFRKGQGDMALCQVKKIKIVNSMYFGRIRT